MKRTFLITLLCAYTFISTSGQNICIANEKMNVLYVGVDNPISIAVEGISSKAVIVKATHGKIFKENSHYMFHADNAGRTEIILYKKVNER